MKSFVRHPAVAVLALLALFPPGAALPSARAEAILQCFNLSHNEIAERIPEIAEAGYSALWIPPPTKANGGMSVGYDLYDPFDIGSTDLRGQYPTRYGTKADLLNLIDVAHRFGMRVYFDNVMNHRAYDVPGRNETTPVDIYPGMVAEDFHLSVTSDGYYRMWPDIVWGGETAWEVMYRPLSGLIDIAHENLWSDGWGPCNGNFGPGSEMGQWRLKPYIVRHAYRKEDTWKLFDRMPYPGKRNEDYAVGDGALQNTAPDNGRNLYTGFGNSAWNPEDPATKALLEQHAAWFTDNDAANGVSMKLIENFPNFYAEKVDDYLNRAVRWLIDATHVDGLRLDAVKHVPYEFFGDAYGEDKDRSDFGYLGQAQWQFNMTRGFNDWTNHRNTVFSNDGPRDDLMAFGEHLGGQPDQRPYIDAGMRLVDSELRSALDEAFKFNQLWDFDQPGRAGFGPSYGIMHAQSHDDDHVDRKPLHHAYYYMRSGLGLVYTDGNNRAAVLPKSGGAFPRWACTDYLGQWGQSQIPTLLKVHENFAMYNDEGFCRGGDYGNYIAWCRGGAWPYTRLLVMFNSDWNSYQPLLTAGHYPHAGGTSDDMYLYNYASTYPGYMTHFKYAENWPEAPYAYASQLADGEVEMPPNSYALWGVKNPDPSEYWAAAVRAADYAAGCTNTSRSGLSDVITVYDDGQVAPVCGVVRKDGVDGDPGFNPNGVEDGDPTDYAYTMAIPVVRGTNVAFGIHLDGEAEHVMARLDGGMDFGNGIEGVRSDVEGEMAKDLRDNPPGAVRDCYLGFENIDNYFIQRTWAEVFAAKDTHTTDHGCVLQSGDATTYEAVIGGASRIWTNSSGIAFNTALKNPSFLYHDPEATGTYRDTTAEPASRRAAAAAGMTCTDHAGETGDWPAGAIDGFREWQFDVYGTDIEGNYAGCYVESPADAGIEGFDGVAYELYANPTNSCGVTVTRWLDLAEGAAVSNFSITLGLNYDSGIDGSYRGFELLDSSGGKIFAIQMGHSPDIYWEGEGASGTWSEGYPEEEKPRAFRVFLSRTETGYAVSGTTRDGGDFAGAAFASSREIAGYKVYMNGSQSGKESQVYFNDATYTAMERTPSGGGEEPPGTDVTFPQFSLDGGHPVVHAKMAHGDGLAAWLYFTTNGAWPNGCAGKSPDRNVSVVRGEWIGNHWERDEATGKWKISGDWWRFTLPALPDGTVLKYKIGGAALQGDTKDGYQGWETVWPNSQGSVEWKRKITGEWRVPREGGLDLTKQQYHKHLDFASWTTGFDEGFHLFTVRCWPDRPRGAEIFNTFRQTFYMDRETPRGKILWPAQDGERIDGKSYRVAVQTDRTVEKVYYHITDASAGNDGPGNGTNAAGRVEWAEAEPVGAWTEDMATNTALPKVWAFNYNGIAPSNRDATIRVRLWEWSSAPTNQWSATSPANDDLAALHVTEIPRAVKTDGDPEYVYVSWPETDESKTVVEAGWKVWVRFTGNLVQGENVSPEDVFAATTVYINTTNSASSARGEPVEVQWNPRDFSWPQDWAGGRGECQMAFTMPNVYNGDDSFLYNITVVIDKNALAEGSRLVRHKGPRLPACIIATPPETDSDGVKYVITMEDSPAVSTNAALRQTPVVIHTDWAVTNLDVSFVRPAGYEPDLVLDSVETNSTALVWKYTWTVAEPGEYTFVATATADLAANTNLSVAVNSATRNATVQFRQMVETTDANDPDWDDDGIANTDETTPVALPKNNAELWSQWDVFTHFRNGRTDRASPDSDCDGLPDGLELGVRWPADGTDATTDTNGDGWKNFLPDLDPPFYDTTDNDGIVKGISKSGTGARRDVIAVGTVTDPNNPDTDYDGLPDGLEDANRNGWTDGDGQSLQPDKDQSKDRTVPNGLVESGETWQETSPCLADSDGDGLSDGYGEDKDLDGKTAIFLRDADGNDEPIDLSDDQWAAYRAVPANALSRAVNWKKLFTDYAVDGTYSGARQKGNGGWPHLIVTETDPLNKDTDGDGLPDGWEIRYGLDPLDNGFYNFATGLPVDPTNSVNGADGNPDKDLLYNADGSTTPNTNLIEFQAGTNPRVGDSIENPGGSGAIVVGTGAEIGKVNETVYRREFLDWTLDDLIAFDDYDQGGKRSDIYRWRDGYDSSRDIVAFYFRDGGVESEGGDGKLYFRVDLDDLAEGAENGKLDIYVAINFGTPGNGEAKLPDDVDALTAMRWNAVVGVKNSTEGVVYVDRDRDHNSTTHADNLAEMGVVKGTYHGAYFNHELDSVMWYIDRADLGTVNPDMFLFQVYTVRDGIEDDGNGVSDKTKERNDFTDTIGDDWICSDDEDEAAYVALNGTYSFYVGKNAYNDCGKHAKIALVAHGNQAIEAGSTIQAIVDNGVGAGYQRSIKIHNIYTNCPLNLHITPTLAMALEWAKTGTEKIWFSGPSLNAEIRSGVAKGNFRLLGSTFSDHILPYFPEEFNRADVALAAEILDAIYGNGGPAVSTNIFWAPERVLDGDTLGQIGAMGYKATLIDQTPHMLEWFNRETSLSSPGYKMQNFWIHRGGDRWVNTRAFVLTTAVDEFRYLNTDKGLPSDLRHLFLRRARSGEAALSSIFYMWEELKEGKNADAYDRNLRWIANHPWTRVVALEDVLDDGNLLRSDDISLPDPSVLPLEAHDWVHHASNENYDNWYYGSDRHEGLAGKTNEVRYGVLLPSGKPFGTKENGILTDTWATVSGIRNADVKRLAQETLFASAFETAFHEESNNNLSRWSYGTYVSPATGLKDNGEKMGLQSFSWRAQSRTRLANVFGEVDDWATRTLPDVEVREKDVDLDGDTEYILRNNRLMALFEREGGLMVGAWLKDGVRVRQVVGNFAAIPENGYEDEESDFVRYVEWEDGSKHGYLAAQRGSALKDVEGGSRTALYEVSTTANALTFTHGALSKTVSLASPATNAFAVSYAGSGALKVRSGLSPDLDALMLTGQANLTETADGTKTLSVTTIRPAEGTGVTATLDVTRGAIDTAATDKPVNVPEEFNTVNMRNAAHVRQVDVTGTGSLAFTLAFGVESTENLPPVITVSPDNDPHVFPVGVTTSFSVKATDPDSATVTLKCENLPETFASFSETTHVFSWTPSSLTQGTRTSDFATNVTFTATDGVNTTSRTVNILIPWDSDGDGLPDDWEYLRFGTFDQDPGTDWDRDEFPDWNEYVAGTSPTDPSDYLGWESLFVDTAAGTATLTFPSVPGKHYAIEASDGPAALVSPDWKEVALLTASGLHTTWVDTDPASATRMYRIRVLVP